jgi:blue copper oxidase
VDQPAATLWYHPHPHERTRRHVYRGLAGMFIIDDVVCGPTGLPCRYGVDDIPVIVQDKQFRGDNQLAEANLADVVCVNRLSQKFARSTGW